MRLAVYAERLAAPFGRFRGGREGKDYVQEAVTETLSGQRRWNRKYSMQKHLEWAINSIIRDYAKHLSSQRHQEPILESCVFPLSNKKEGTQVRFDLNSYPSPGKTPEVEFEIKSILMRVTEDLARILAGDPLVVPVFEAKLDGLTGSEIQKKFGITAKQYVAMDQQIRRAMKVIVKQLQTK